MAAIQGAYLTHCSCFERPLENERLILSWA